MAIKYCYRYNDCIKLILVDSAGIVHHGLWYHLKVICYKMLKKLHIKVNMGSDDYKMASPVMQRVLVNCTNESLVPYMSSISIPTLIIYGEKDTITPPSDGRIMEKNIPDSGLVIIPNSGHFPFIDNPKYFLLVVDSFISDIA